MIEREYGCDFGCDGNDERDGSVVRVVASFGCTVQPQLRMVRRRSDVSPLFSLLCGLPCQNALSAGILNHLQGNEERNERCEGCHRGGHHFTSLNGLR